MSSSFPNPLTEEEERYYVKRLEENDEEHFQQYLYSYKFINMTKEAEESLKDLLLQRFD